MSTYLSLFTAGAISTKYVGLFIYVYVGLHTILRLWELLGDTSSSITRFIEYFAAHFFCLILGKHACHPPSMVRDSEKKWVRIMKKMEVENLVTHSL